MLVAAQLYVGIGSEYPSSPNKKIHPQTQYPPSSCRYHWFDSPLHRFLVGIGVKTMKKHGYGWRWMDGRANTGKATGHCSGNKSLESSACGAAAARMADLCSSEMSTFYPTKEQFILVKVYANITHFHLTRVPHAA